MSCDLHKLEANLHSKLPVAPFSYKKVWHWKSVWVEGRVGGKAGLRIAYSNQKSCALIGPKIQKNMPQFRKKYS